MEMRSYRMYGCILKVKQTNATYTDWWITTTSITSQNVLHTLAWHARRHTFDNVGFSLKLIKFLSPKATVFLIFYDWIRYWIGDWIGEWIGD